MICSIEENNSMEVEAMKKVCFVVMGFGKKFDYRSRKSVDLDIVYHNVIKPLFEEKFSDAYDVVRNDEIATTGILDKCMYEKLLNADLVIADITTHNDNAIYELGVRHALRPASTIILSQKMCKRKVSYMFDLNHCNITSYENLNDEKNISTLKNQLAKLIKASEKNDVDSPVYTYLPNLNRPNIKKENECHDYKTELTTIADLLCIAQTSMRHDDFIHAIDNWEKLNVIIPDNEYIIQQLALATYKSKSPNEIQALISAKQIINKLNPGESMNPETLGIAGAINKRLFLLTAKNEKIDLKILHEAITCYKRAYVTLDDYYNGENYANCLLLLLLYDNTNPKSTLWNLTRLDICESIISSFKNETRLSKWELATYAVCLYHLGDFKNAKIWEQKFKDAADAKWEKNTFDETVNMIKKYNSTMFGV